MDRMSPRRPLPLWLVAVGVAALLSVGGVLLVDRTAEGPAVLAEFVDAVKAEGTIAAVGLPAQDGQRGTAVVVEAGPTEDVTAVAPPAEDASFLTLPTYRASVTVDVTATDEEDARAVLATVPDGVVHVAAITVTTTTLGGVPATIAQVDR